MKRKMPEKKWQTKEMDKGNVCIESIFHFLVELASYCHRKFFFSYHGLNSNIYTGLNSNIQIIDIIDMLEN